MSDDPTPPDVPAGHDGDCELTHAPAWVEPRRFRGCHCIDRAYARDPLGPVEPVDVPWGLFGWQRGQPDTRGKSS